MKNKVLNIDLSIILTSRNDGYPEGRGTKLLQFALTHLIKNLKKIDKHLEIIIVDYNPPPDKKNYIKFLK